MDKIIVTVEKPWNGMVAVRDRYVDQAKVEKKDLLIQFKGGELLISKDNLNRYAFKSQKPFRDKFSQKSHYLIYYRMPAKARTVEPEKQMCLF